MVEYRVRNKYCMELLNKITNIIITILVVLVAFKFFLYFLGVIVKRKKYPEAKKNHKYAIAISARNESGVIGNLLHSIFEQDYPQDLLTIFVVADNCTDHTASEAKRIGGDRVIVYERDCVEKARKGYALQFLFEKIAQDFGVTSFDGYFFFDADNVLAPNFIKEMNKAFDAGAKIVNSYRNTKNFDTNFISASYGIHWCRSSLSFHRPRTALSSSTHIAGTGFLVASSILQKGWSYVELTEDAEFTTEVVSKGYKIEFCEDAEFFDEQPIDLKTSFRQRLRWTKGRLAVFFKGGYKLLNGLFKNKCNRKFACYDIFFYMFPYSLLVFLVGAIVPIASTIIAFVNKQPLPFLIWIDAWLKTFVTTYCASFFEGILILVREQKHIYCSKGKQILYLFLWPWFDFLSLPLTIASLFMKITWKPIKHVDRANYKQVSNKKIKKYKFD